MTQTKPPRSIGCVMDRCDFCHTTSCSQYLFRPLIKTDRYLGWLSCERPECLSACEASLPAAIYPKEKLEQEFSVDQFRVKRSNGCMDDPGSWKIVSDASIRQDEQMWLTIQKTRNPPLLKEVPLSDLRKWQKPRIEFLMGLSHKAGKDSSIYRAFVLKELSETRLIHCIFRF